MSDLKQSVAGLDHNVTTSLYVPTHVPRWTASSHGRDWVSKLSLGGHANSFNVSVWKWPSVCLKVCK